MDADLDTLCTVVYCTADDLLPEARANARRRVTDAELVTLCVAQAIMGIPSDRRFLAVARKRLVHLFPDLPGQSAYFNAAAAWPTPSSGSWASLPPQARALPTTCCSATRRRSSVAAAGRPPCARRLARSPATATVRLTRASSGACVCTASSPSMVRRGRSSSPTLPVMGARSPSSCLRAPCAAASCCSATRATPAGPSPGRRGTRRQRGASQAQRRARPGSSPGAHPAAHRVDLLDGQGPAHPGAPRGAHHGRPARARAAAVPLPRRLHQPQPCARGGPSRSLVIYCA